MNSINTIFEYVKNFDTYLGAYGEACRKGKNLNQDEMKELTSCLKKFYKVEDVNPRKSIIEKAETDITIKCRKVYGFYSDQLLLNVKDESVKIIPNLTNYKLIIQHLHADIRYSEFERQSYIGKKAITQDNILEIAQEVTTFLKGHNVKIKEIENAVRLLAIENKFNPLSDYFKSLPVSTTNHLENWLTTICGTVDSQINRIIGRKWLISCVARAMNPGSYVEGSLIFFGKQAAGKTRFFKMINPKEEYYCGSNVDISNTQKASQTYQGKFIIEFGELAAINKANLEDTKQYLTETHDTYVPKYENFPVSIPRMMVFGGSTNHPGILNDTTGNRRFWCVEVADEMKIDLLMSIKEELWSEAYQAYLNKESWLLSKEEREILEDQNSTFEADDPLKEHMMEYVNNVPDNQIGSKKLVEIAKNYDLKAHAQTVSKIMIKLGWTRSKFTTGPAKDCSCYNRPKCEVEGY
jgi:predicted P-loop ATPase